jgi:hypothetical protein
MSRGPGRWQRAILDELHRREVFYLREVLPAPSTRSEQLAVIRAAHRLASRGLIVVDVERQHWKRAAWGAVVVARPGVVIDRLTLAAFYHMRENLQKELSDSSCKNDLLSLSEVSPALLAIYREEEAATRQVQAARQQTKAARQQTEAARQTVARVTLEEAVARRVAEVLLERAERELAEKWQREFEQQGEALRQALMPPKDETSPRPTAQRGAIASLMKLLGQEGPITEALIVERAQEFLRWPPAQVLDVIEQLKASGDYQRIIDEASS